MSDIGSALVEVLDAFLAAVVRKARKYAAIATVNRDLMAGRLHVAPPLWTPHDAAWADEQPREYERESLGRWVDATEYAYRHMLGKARR